MRIASIITDILRRLRFDDRGAALVYVTIGLPVFLGLGLLAVDAGRLYNLNTHLQKASDALALAGAAELDRRPDSITRATNAIQTLVDNEQRFASGGADVSVQSIRFLHSLPPSDATPIDTGYETTNPLQAGFVEVTVSPREFNTLFPASLVGAVGTSTVSAHAVAGFTAVACKIAPMFICNPFEGITTLDDPNTRGRQIKMQLHGGNNAQFYPGNYGWLDTPVFQNGAVGLKAALASASPPVCFAQNGVTVQTGNINPAEDALNVRFDLWEGSLKSEKSNQSYRPAQNVRKGYGTKGKACTPDKDPDGDGDPSTNAARLGRDADFPGAQGRLGNGTWDFDTYWATNFPDVPAPNNWSNNNLPSRYEVYRHEVSTMGTGALSDLVARASPSPYDETGGPQCYSGGGLSDNPDRRIIYAAIINCSQYSVSGASFGPIPVYAFGKFFLTEPVPQAPNPDAGTVFAEFVDILKPGDGNDVVRDVVQLYR